MRTESYSNRNSLSGNKSKKEQVRVRDKRETKLPTFRFTACHWL